jgi:hypothetical protein
MWFLHRKAILTKDNLIKRNWNDNESWCCCDNKESIQRLFFECPLAKIIWCIIHMTFGLELPKNVSNLFRNWLKGILKEDLIKIRVGVWVVIWAIWDTRNNFIFNKPKNTHFCRLSLWLPTGSVSGPISNKRRSGEDGFWVQPFGEGSSRFIQLVRLAIAQ